LCSKTRYSRLFSFNTSLFWLLFSFGGCKAEYIRERLSFTANVNMQPRDCASVKAMSFFVVRSYAPVDRRFSREAY